MTVTLRAQETTDLEFLHSLFSDPEVVRYWFVEPYVTRADFEAKFEARRGDPTSRRFIIDDDGESVGIVELVDIRRIHRNCEFQIIVAPGRQGHGYAQTATTLVLDYAFNTLNLHKVYLQVDDENKGAIHVYSKCGFHVEGHQRDEFWVDGAYHDVTRMAVFADDPRPQA
ncbi:MULTISPECIES: GNAT family N-acetyltransferase [Gordonia]|jgi:diamine N-acetyltransferase|uniref:Putative acetyltransferase n=1 Tax=Gordonia malaquae NBRC 108250 TaxID=1223542 RepID=M3VFH0_GORML|nr:GNAT family N-acetyltransferase [Gordonia malaquae]GAC80089.1 putative acetyltransferase [Gordonia malaquae NBRC 108250]SEC37044.1 diamine N-acetyltransferase [Gordonia malaquae]